MKGIKNPTKHQVFYNGYMTMLYLLYKEYCIDIWKLKHLIISEFQCE